MATAKNNTPGGLRVIKVPDVGEGIAEVELTEWHVKVGDTVQEDQALADVMTDKANVEVPSPVAGRVVALGCKVGQMISVGAELIRIAPEGMEDVDGGEAVETASAPEAAAAAPSAPASTPAAAKTTAPATAAVATASKGTAPAPAKPHTPVAPATTPQAAAPRAPGDRAIASPAVRRRAWELGVDLQAVSATGTAGRITHADLEAHAQAHPEAATPATPASTTSGKTAAAPLAQASAPAVSTLPTYAERHDEEAIPVIGLRRRIAMQMQESKRRIPHFSYVEELDVTEIEGLRASLNQRWAPARGKLTLLPLLMRAIVIALRDFPQINARFDDDAGVITRHGAVHLGVAAQTPNGLMVPVVRHAESRDVWALASEVSRLAEAARTGRATRSELSGSTITLSSLGALGGIVTTPVINRPEVAIVGVNRIVERPVLQKGQWVARQTMNLSSSFDHRAVDGMDAAQFIQAVRALVESPALLFVE